MMSSSDRKNRDNEHHHNKKRRKDDDKATWHVKSLDEILEEKRQRKEQEEKRQQEKPDKKREPLKLKHLEDGELHRNVGFSQSPQQRARHISSGDERMEEDDLLQIQPPQLGKLKGKDEGKKHSKHRDKDDKRHKSRKRSQSKEDKDKSTRGRDRSRPAAKERTSGNSNRREDPRSSSGSHDRSQGRHGDQSRYHEAGRHTDAAATATSSSSSAARHLVEMSGRHHGETSHADNDRYWFEREQSRRDRERLERLERDRQRDAVKRNDRPLREPDRGGQRERERSRKHDDDFWRYKEESKYESREPDRQERRTDGQSRDERRGRVVRERSPIREHEVKPRESSEHRPRESSSYDGDHHQDIVKDRRGEDPAGRDHLTAKTTTTDDASSSSSEEEEEGSSSSSDNEESGEQSGRESAEEESGEQESASEDEEEEEEEEEEDNNEEDSSSEAGGEGNSADEGKEDGERARSSEEEEEGEEEEDEDDSSDSEETDSDSESGSESENASKASSTASDRTERDIRKAAKDNGHHSSPPASQNVQKSKFDIASSPGSDDDVIVAATAAAAASHDYLPDSPPQSPVELKEQLPPYYPAVSGCRSVEEFMCLNRIEEGTFGVVYRAKEKRTGEVVALKRLKMEKEREGFPITSLREVNTLLKAQHPNIVTVREIVVGSNMDKIYIVMDYVEHDLKSLMETMKQPFTIGETKCLMVQLLRGVHHLHDNWILHRDLKLSNLLLSHRGELKIADFGLAREYGSPLKHYTPVVVTLWYRAPELLLGGKEYSCPIDIWSVGCIFAELVMMKPLFPGRSEVDQLNRIFKELGTPSEKIWPGYNELPAVKKMTFAEHPYNNLRNRIGNIVTDAGFDLMNRFLTYNPERRVPAEEAVQHVYFRESPQPIEKSMFPTWPAKSEMPRSGKRSPKPPEGGLQYAKLDEEGATEEGFRLTVASQGNSVKTAGFNLRF